MKPLMGEFRVGDRVYHTMLPVEGLVERAIPVIDLRTGAIEKIAYKVRWENDNASLYGAEVLAPLYTARLI